MQGLSFDHRACRRARCFGASSAPIGSSASARRARDVVIQSRHRTARPMDAPQDKKSSWLRRLLERAARGTVEDAPKEIAACEFECRKLDCRHGEWDTCPLRLNRMARDED